MRHVYRLTFILLFALASMSPLQAEFIRHTFIFGDSGDPTTGATQNVTGSTWGGTYSFDFSLSVSAVQGGSTTVYESELGGPGGLGGLSLSSTTGLFNAATNQANGDPFENDEIQFDIAFSGVDLDTDGNGVDVVLSDLTFELMKVNFGSSGFDSGALKTSGATSNWIDANNLPADFYGHYPTASRFNIQQANASTGVGLSTAKITSFSHETTGSNAFGYTLNNFQVSALVTGTPEPSSIVLGLVAMLLCVWRFGWRRIACVDGLPSHGA